MDREVNYSDCDLQFGQQFSPEMSIKQESQFRNNSLPEENNFQLETVSRRSKKSLRNDQIEALNQKRQNLEHFMISIGECSNQLIRSDILDHCEKVSIHIPQNLTKNVVLRLVKNRVDKMIKNKRIKKNWSEEDINILVWVISKYCQFHGISQIKQGITDADWASIAELIPGVTGKSCMFKWLSLKKSNLAQNSWGEDQSLLLHQMVKNYGQNAWCRISQQLYLRNTAANKVYRCPKQCRQHWNCYLNPKLKKGPWQKKQDYLLLRAVKQLQGVKKWAQIVKLFNGRTQNALKNRFTLIVQKEQKDHKNKKKCTQYELIQIYLKRYENAYHVDQQKLKFLKDKRQQIIQNQSKKKPKKNRPKKIKQINNNSQQQDQYIPMQSQQKQKQKQKQKIINLRSNPRARTSSRQYQYSHYIKHSTPQKQQIYYDKDSSINQIVSIKRQEQIFQSDEEQVQPMHQFQAQDQDIHSGIQIQPSFNHFQEYNIISHMSNFTPFYQDQLSYLPQYYNNNSQNLNLNSNISVNGNLNISNNSNIVKQKITVNLPRFDHDERSTEQLNGVQQAEVNIVPFNDIILEQLKKSQNTLFPCCIAKSNNNNSLLITVVNNNGNNNSSSNINAIVNN